MGHGQHTRRAFLAACAMAPAVRPGTSGNPSQVSFLRLPAGGLQPRIAADSHGQAHLLYFEGSDPLTGDLIHAQIDPAGRLLNPAKVNTHPGSAIATGTVRGGHIAIGKDDTVHVAWNGSKDAEPKGPGNANPMLYTRKAAGAASFERERNVIRRAYGLDGGGALAADRSGNVYVFWHAPEPGSQGEEHRRVWLARSTDGGAGFHDESAVTQEPTGVCGCCGMAAFSSGGNVYALYRSAHETIHRDMYLLSSPGGGRFESRKVDRWDVGYCVMSTAAFASAGPATFAAWETEGQIRFARLDQPAVRPSQAPGDGKGRKHPALASNPAGDTILVWTEGTGWKKGGSLAWRIYDRDGRPKGDPGQALGIPAFSFAAAFARPDGGFTIVY